MNVTGFDAGQSFNQFIKLMVSQIQYQDPLNPVSQENSTAQLAQISTVSGIEQLNMQFSEMLKVQSMFSGAQVVGKEVQYKSPASNETLLGRIAEARMVSGQLKLLVGDQQIGLSDVLAIVDSQVAA